jgi:hypothetical protein
MHILVMLVAYCVGSIVVSIVNVNLLMGVLLPYLFPSIYGILVIQKARAKILIFAWLSTILLAFAFEALATVFVFWNTYRTIGTVLGLVNFENLLFFFLHQIAVITSYLILFKQDSSQINWKRFAILIFLYSSFCSLVMFVIFNNINIEISYLLFGLIVIVAPVIMQLIYLPHLLSRMILISCIWAIPILINEYAVVSSELVMFTGNYLYIINLGILRLPLEELMYWVILSPPAIVLGFKFFVDGEKR